MWLLKSMLRVHPPPLGSSKKQKEDFDLNLLQTCSLWSKADCLARFGPHSNCRDTVFRFCGWGEKWHESGCCNRLAEDLSCLDVPCRKCTDNCWPVGWQVWPRTLTCWATPNHNAQTTAGQWVDRFDQGLWPVEQHPIIIIQFVGQSPAIKWQPRDPRKIHWATE